MSVISNFTVLFWIDYGQGYKWSEPYLVIEAGDMVVWQWEAPDYVTSMSYRYCILLLPFHVVHVYYCNSLNI